MGNLTSNCCNDNEFRATVFYKRKSSKRWNVLLYCCYPKAYKKYLADEELKKYGPCPRDKYMGTARGYR